MDSLQDKTLVMIVGPSAIGKSTLMNEVVRKRADFGRVSGFTTRAPRPNDEAGMYRYFSKEEAIQKIEKNELVQYAVFPTTGHIYGSEARDYPAHYNLLDTLANVVDELRELPFENTITISLTARPDQWRNWFLSRYPQANEEAEKRLKEAKLSIEWSLQDPETYWLENAPDQVAQTAKKLIDIVTNQPPRATIPTEPQTILNLIKKGMWN